MKMKSIGYLEKVLIKNIPDGWRVETLESIATLVGGGTPSRAKSEYWNSEGIIWLSPTDLGRIDEIVEIANSKDKITLLGLKKSSATILPIGTVLYSSRATIGKIAINTVEVSTNQGFTNFICNDNILNKYLALCLIKYRNDITMLSNSTTFKEISKSSFKKFKIPIPPFSEQEKIVKVLDISSQLIKKQNELIADYNLFLKSKFIEMFGDPIKNPMEWEVSSIRNGVEKIKNDNPLKQPQKEYIYIDIGSLNDKAIKKYNYILGEEAPSRAKQITSFNDIVISTVRPNLNNVAMVKTQYHSVLSSTGFCILRTNNRYFNQYYLFEVVKHKGFIQSLVNVAKGASYPAVSNNDILDLKISIPPIDLQNKFASIVEQINTIKLKETQKLEHLETLHKSLMNKAFKGEIQ